MACSSYKVIDIRSLCNQETAIQPTDDFECPICYQLVIKAEKCFTCEKLFCGDCVAQVRRNRAVCPVDRSAPWQTSKVTRIDSKKLFALKFKCKQCSKHFSYDSGHNCAGFCPANCGAQLLRSPEVVK